LSPDYSSLQKEGLEKHLHKNKDDNLINLNNYNEGILLSSTGETPYDQDDEDDLKLYAPSGTQDKTSNIQNNYVPPSDLELFWGRKLKI
jgi:hypothetical protein